MKWSLTGVEKATPRSNMLITGNRHMTDWVASHHTQNKVTSLLSDVALYSGLEAQLLRSNGRLLLLKLLL